MLGTYLFAPNVFKANHGFTLWAKRTMPEFEIYIVYKWCYINTLPFL